MVEFALYVGCAYLVYYLVVIGLEFLKSPKGVVQDTSTSYDVYDSDAEIENESEVIDDIEFSSQGEQAIKKKRIRRTIKRAA